MKGLTKLSLVGAISALFALSAYAQPYSIDGNDWQLDFVGNLIASGGISTTIAINQTGVPITLVQTDNDFDGNLDDSSIPVSFPPYITTTLPAGFFVIGGQDGVRANQFVPGPIVLPGSVTGLPLDIRIRNITLNLAGIITGNNTLVTELYGTRVYEITGIPSTNPFSTNPNTSWGQIRDIDVQFFGQWIRAAEARLEVASWRLYRPVPEPASMLALGSGLASLIALRRRKK